MEASAARRQVTPRVHYARRSQAFRSLERILASGDFGLALDTTAA